WLSDRSRTGNAHRRRSSRGSRAARERPADRAAARRIAAPSRSDPQNPRARAASRMSAAPESLPTFELLDPTSHRHLRLRGKSDAAPHFVHIVASEFAAAAACCPILFTKE